MYYVYILWSSKFGIFYYGFTEQNPQDRLIEHNQGISFSTKPYRPWALEFYACFSNKKLAKNFERYLKSGSGKAFAYKRLVDEALKKDRING